MVDEKNYPVFARIFKGRICAVRSDDTPNDPHRIYIYDADIYTEGHELRPSEYTAYIEKNEVIE